MVEFTLPGVVVRLLKEGSPTESVRAAVNGALKMRAGRGWQFHFRIDPGVAEEMAGYLSSVAGVVGDMTGAEREGGREAATAARGVTIIDAALGVRS